MADLKSNCLFRISLAAISSPVFAFFLAAALPLSAAHAQSHSGHSNHGSVDLSIKDVSVDELAKSGSSLAEIVVGKADARITIIEYASMTCGHCGNFHREILPEVKKKYIDTGLARLVFREFPIENVAAAASMIARCAGPEKTYNVIAAMFERQREWLVGPDVRAGLVKIAGEFGMTEQAFDQCLDRKELLQQIAAMRTRANKVFGVKSTPTFFINGSALVGARSIGDFDEIIEPMLKQE